MSEQTRVLVAVASRHGATRRIAQRIAANLERRGIETELVAAEEWATDLDGYNAVVLGSAVYFGQWLESARDFTEHHGERLARMPVWLFSSGPLGPAERLIPEGDCVDAAPMVAATRALGHRTFAGKLDKSALRFHEKAVVAALHAPEGDFRDWDAIEGWAAEIAGRLRAQPA